MIYRYHSANVHSVEQLVIFIHCYGQERNLVIREKVLLGIEHGANSELFHSISKQADGRISRDRLFLEIESQTLRFDSLRAF